MRRGGSKPPGLTFPFSLRGYSKSTPEKGMMTTLEKHLQRMGHVHIYTFTKVAASPQLLSQAIASLW